MLCLSTMFLVLLSSYQVVKEDPSREASKLEEMAIESRRRITSGVFEVDAEGWCKNGSSRQKFESKCKIVLDGEYLLNDLTRIGAESFREVRSWGPEVVYFSDRQIQGGGKIAASVSDPASTHRIERQKLIDPRMIGMYPANFLNLSQFGLTQGLRSESTKRYLEVRKEVVDGSPCAVIVRELIHGVTVRVWIDTARNFSVVRFQLEHKLSGEPELVDLRMELSAFPDAKAWFPTRCSMETKRGGELVSEENLSIKVELLNKSIDDGLFKMANMDIPSGTGVQAMGKLSRPGLSQWDGQEIVPLEAKPTSQWIASRVILVSLAVVLACFGAVVIWKGSSNKSFSK